MSDRRQELETLFSQYAKYKALVCRQMYEDLNAWTSRQSATEKEWKEQYGSSTELIDTPTYLSKTTSGTAIQAARSQNAGERLKKTARGWLKQYLQNVQRRQEFRQNHVHVWNEKKICKMPLTHCQSSDDSTKCKAGFPRTTWMVDKTLILCKEFLEQRKMLYTGKKT